MTLVVRFLVYNLLLSLAAGLLAWLMVIAALRLMRIGSSVQGLTLFSLPLFKSFLILLGVGLVFPWPGQLFESWRLQALPFWQVLPFLLVWTASLYLVYRDAIRHTRLAVLKDARPAAESTPRLAAVYATVTEAFQHVPCPTLSLAGGQLDARQALTDHRAETALREAWLPF